MNITAGTLHKKANTGQVREEIDNILRTLEGLILSAHEQRVSTITHELPTNFSISNMALKDAQRVIYCGIIEELEKRQFRVRIRINPTNTFIKISWVSMYDKEEMERMTNVIASHAITADPQQQQQYQ